MTLVQIEDLRKMTVAELEAYSDQLHGKVGRDYLKMVMQVRNQKIRDEHLDHWGLTQDEYDQAKESHRAELAEKGDRSRPLGEFLSLARRLANRKRREAQTQTATAGQATADTTANAARA